MFFSTQNGLAFSAESKAVLQKLRAFLAKRAFV